LLLYDPGFFQGIKKTSFSTAKYLISRNNSSLCTSSKNKQRKIVFLYPFEYFFKQNKISKDLHNFLRGPDILVKDPSIKSKEPDKFLRTKSTILRAPDTSFYGSNTLTNDPNHISNYSNNNLRDSNKFSRDSNKIPRDPYKLLKDPDKFVDGINIFSKDDYTIFNGTNKKINDPSSF